MPTDTNSNDTTPSSSQIEAVTESKYMPYGKAINFFAIVAVVHTTFLVEIITVEGKDY